MFTTIKSWYTSTIEAVKAEAARIVAAINDAAKAVQAEARKAYVIVAELVTKTITRIHDKVVVMFASLPESVQTALMVPAAVVVVCAPALVVLGTVVAYFISPILAGFILLDIIVSGMFRRVAMMAGRPIYPRNIALFEVGVACVTAAALMNPICLIALSIMLEVSAIALFACKVGYFAGMQEICA